MQFSGAGRFLYRSVSQTLRARIESGDYGPGSRIPTVEEFAREFGVSTITVRRAVRDLSLEGLLVGRQGLGLFVATRRRIDRNITAGRIAPIEEDVRRAGFEPSLREIGMSLVAADDEPTGKLRSRGGLYRLERVLVADEEPVALDTLWLPPRVRERLKKELQGRFVMPLLEPHGIEIDHIDYHFEAATASESQAGLLDVITGFPLLVARFTPIGPDGSPVLVGCTTARADRFTYAFCGRPQAHRSARFGKS